jgi:hypothetical protein
MENSYQENRKFTLSKVKNRDDNLYYAFGENKNIYEWVRDKRCSINTTLLKTRINSGWPVEQAIISPPNHKKKNKLFLAFGEWKSLKDWAKDLRCVVSYDILRNRLNKNIDLEKSLTTKINKQQNKKIAKKDKKIYRLWYDINNRCSPQYKDSVDYYQRGIYVCDEWNKNKNNNSFLNFKKWMKQNPKPSKLHSLAIQVVNIK